ncbi:helix-turn-helix domain-containing protein [Streptomyces sp. NPDC058694]|uniref:helix-turn-helix domain-containing protein n=1 Tax=Streptomyces sp. NPDC058694 TaxID=3346603 RepID=UPI003648E403
MGTGTVRRRSVGMRGGRSPHPLRPARRGAGAPGTPVLLDTLRTWPSLQGSWDRTAATLHVHRNTVRHRLARVGELLVVDLQDPWPCLPGRADVDEAVPAAQRRRTATHLPYFA